MTGRDTLWVAAAIATALAVGCGSSDSTEPATRDGSHGVTQGGPQDIARFREIVASGSVPSPDTLDPVGFFAEHAVDLPPADCGRDVCLHPMLAVAPRFDGGNWTMAYVGMNSPLDPSTLERPPLHLVVAYERTRYTAEQQEAVETGLDALVGQMRPEDRLSLVVFGRNADVRLRGAEPSRAEVGRALLDARDGSVSEAAGLYDAIAVSGRVAQGLEGFDGSSRILLLSSGHADAGITDPERVLEAAAAYAQQGTALNVVGIGEDYRPALPQQLGELGIGNWARAEDAADLEEILRAEGATTMFPLATGFELRIEPAAGYGVGRIYGARRATAQGGEARLGSPALFLGHRTGADDVEDGRRGGGGGLFVELLADPAAAADIGAGQPAYTLTASWTSSTGEPVSIRRTVVNELPPAQNPDGMWPSFSAPEHGKPFMMLNMYLALRATTRFHEAGDCARSQGVVDMMVPSVEGWQERYDDPDIAADYELLLGLRGNVSASCTQRPLEPDYFAGSCMYL
ncbi:MAG: hypothetical protein ACOCUS_06145 [Polyangiales bacterium]